MSPIEDHVHVAPNPLVAGRAAPGENPASALIEAVLGQLDAIAATLGARAEPLTIAERQRLLKMKTGGEAHVESVVDIGERYGLVIPGIDPAEVKDDLRFLRDAAALLARFEVIRGLVHDMTRETQSRAWQSGTTTYTILTRLVPRFPSLQRELAPMASFLALKYKDAPTSLRKQERRSRKKRAADAPPVAASAVDGS